MPQELRDSLHLRPDPERASHLERCWKGGTVGAYLAKFDTYFPQEPPIRDFSYYATELRGSVPLSDQGDARTIEMNDIVEVTGHDRQTPLVRFIQKGKGVVSFTGENLYEVQVIVAVDKALAALGGLYHFIAAVAELVDGTLPRLVFLIEFDDEITQQDGSALVDNLDTALGGETDDYVTKRKSLRYGAPVIRVVQPG